MAHQYHSINLHRLSPLFEAFDKESLGMLHLALCAVPKGPPRPARQAAAKRVDRQHAPTPPLSECRQRRIVDPDAGAKPVHAYQRVLVWWVSVLCPLCGHVLDGVDVQPFVAYGNVSCINRGKITPFPLCRSPLLAAPLCIPAESSGQQVVLSRCQRRARAAHEIPRIFVRTAELSRGARVQDRQ